MVKNVLVVLNCVHPAALVILSWLAFVFGVFVDQAWLKLIPLSAARVLPRALHYHLPGYGLIDVHCARPTRVF